MRAVLAGSYVEFREYVRNNPDVEMIFCDSWPTFAGLKFSDLVEIGSFRKRPDALDIYQHVVPMIRRDKK